MRPSSEHQLFVRLTPKADRDAVEGWGQDAYGNDVLLVRVKAVPEKGKANKSLRNLLADYLKVKKSELRVVSGATSRNKKIAIDQLSEIAKKKLALKKPSTG